MKKKMYLYFIHSSFRFSLFRVFEETMKLTIGELKLFDRHRNEKGATKKKWLKKKVMTTMKTNFE